MPIDRTAQVRSHILDQLEAGRLRGGDRVPSARDLAEDLGISFLKVQQAMETLAQDGVLEIRPRIGAFVQEAWRERALPENVSIFNRREALPWIDGLAPLIEDHLPGLRFTHAFPRSILELKTTITVQTNHDDYLDLAPYVDEIFPRKDLFFSEPFAPFRISGRLVGVPLIFSPRVLYYNETIFRRHGVPLPRSGWTWDAFLDTCRALAPKLPPGLTLNWTTMAFFWLNLVLRGGGRIFSADAEDPIHVDDPATRAALQRMRDLGRILGMGAGDPVPAYAKRFATGEAAMCIGERQTKSLLHHHRATGWSMVPLPLMPDGRDCTSQTTDLLCVRRTCTDPQLIRTWIATMLSEPVQDHLAATGYGIPIRRSSAFASLDYQDPHDALLIAEIPKMATDPGIADAGLARQVFGGVERLLRESDDLDRDLIDLGAAARTWWRTSRFLARAQEPAATVP